MWWLISTAGPTARLPHSQEGVLGHAAVQLHRAVFQVPRLADGDTHPTDGGVFEPVESPLHRDGAGRHVRDLKAFHRTRSWPERAEKRGGLRSAAGCGGLHPSHIPYLPCPSLPFGSAFLEPRHIHGTRTAWCHCPAFPLLGSRRHPAWSPCWLLLSPWVQLVVNPRPGAACPASGLHPVMCTPAQMRSRSKANPAAEAAQLPHTLRPLLLIPSSATSGLVPCRQRWAQRSLPARGSSPRASLLTTGKFFQVLSLSSSVCFQFILQPSQGLRITEDAAVSACPTTLPPPTEQMSPVPAEACWGSESTTVVIFCWTLQPHPACTEASPDRLQPGPDPDSKRSTMLQAQTTHTCPGGLGYSFHTLFSLATEKRRKKPSTPSTFNPVLQGLGTAFFSHAMASRFRLEQTSRTGSRRRPRGGHRAGSSAPGTGEPVLTT